MISFFQTIAGSIGNNRFSNGTAPEINSTEFTPYVEQGYFTNSYNNTYYN